MGKINEGVEAAKRSVCDSKPSNNHLSRFVREFNYIQLLLEQGTRSLAIERAEVVRGLAASTTSPRAIVLSKLSQGMVEVFHGTASAGLDLLDQAADDSRADYVLYQDALAALIKAHEELGNYEQALQHLQQLLNFVKEKRARFAIWHLEVGSKLVRVKMPMPSDVEKLDNKHVALRAKVAESRLAQCQIEMLERLAVTADLREERSGEHGYRVGHLSGALAQALGWTYRDAAALELAARLHDVGKIAVPDRILLTSERLKEAERRFMNTHTVIGAELLAKSNIPELHLAEEIALFHHEWWDGTGYPKNLAGKRIPIHARIVALADVFDALTHGRPYSPPWSIDRAIEEIHGRRGTQFDPELTDRFIEVVERLRSEHPDLDEYLGRAGRNSPFLQARQKIKLMLARERDHEQKTTVAGNETRH
jgi:putative two-component system response regulator